MNALDLFHGLEDLECLPDKPDLFFIALLRLLPLDILFLFKRDARKHDLS